MWPWAVLSNRTTTDIKAGYGLVGLWVNKAADG
jgi:hypothetical protein